MRNILKKLTVKEWLLYITVFTIPIIVILFMKKWLDNDIWYLLAEGNYITQNGIYYTDVLSIHSGLAIVVQNWLSAVLLWMVYAFLKIKGIFFIIVICNLVISFLLYKICMLISDKNKILSLIITLITNVSLCPYFMVSRPQLFSFIILLVLIYLLELYISTGNKKYLYYLPLLSFLEINLHASLWWMLILFMIPYLIDSFRCDILKLQGYPKKPLFIAFGLSLLVGLINPYGFQSILFIFKSYGDPYMLTYIAELQPYNIKSFFGVHITTIIFSNVILCMFFREEKIRIRYLCLFFGTLILGLISIKGFSHFILVSLFPLAFLLKDKVPKNIISSKKILKKIGNILIPIAFASCLIVLFFANKDYKNVVLLSSRAEDAVNAIDLFTNNNPANAKVYASFNNGGYVEFRGYKAYIDPRAEVFLKKNNGKEDIHNEYYDFEFGKIELKDFLNKYNFDFLLVDLTDRLYNDMDLENYFVIYDDLSTGYKVYARNGIVTDEFRIMLMEEYAKQMIKRQEEIQKQLGNTNQNSNNNNTNVENKTQNTNNKKAK